MKERRVAVTGLGLVTPLGLGAADFWSALVRGDSGVAGVNLADPEQLPRQLAAQVPHFNARSYVSDRALLRLATRSDSFGLAAAQMAVNEAGPVEIAPARKGVFIATSKEKGPIEPLFDAIRASRNEQGELTAVGLGREGFPQIPPLTLVVGLPNGCLFALSVMHSLHGANTNFAGSGEASLLALGSAYRAIREGDADWALAGGCDSATNRWSYANFYRLGLLSQGIEEPARAVKPFDRRRDGFAVGEGAGMVVLEELESARRRGAEIWGEITGYSATCDAAGMVAPRADGASLAKAIRAALQEANLDPGDLGYINAYGSATQTGDRTELEALEEVFGAGRRRPLISGIKGAIGHLVAASGAVELGATLLALRHQVFPPTLNLEEPEPDCSFDLLPGQARPASLTTALTISRGIGGQNAVLALRR